MRTGSLRARIPDVGPRRVFSGIQPTGDFHVGSYVGALRNWVALQDQFDETIYCVVDLHAMTIPYEPADLRASRHESARMLLAVGVDPERSLLYYQSEVPSTSSCPGSSAPSPGWASWSA